MKKLLLIALSAISFSSHAQTVFGVGAGLDYDSATSNRGGLNSIRKESVLVGARGAYGNLDAGYFNVHIDGKNFSDNQPGVEIGYGHGVPIGPVILSGRIAAGKVWSRGLGSKSDTGTYSTYTISLGLPITKQLSVLTSYRYRPEHDFDRQEQYSVGVSYLLTKETSIQATVRQTRSASSPILNGFSTLIIHAF